MTVLRIEDENLEPNEFGLLPDLSRQWGMTFVRFRSDLPLAGSPERTTWRSMLETDDGRLFVLEKIPSRWLSRKLRIAALLHQLHNFGLNRLSSYQPDCNGEFIPLIRHGLWQLCPFVEGVALNRPEYAMDGWRGDAAAGFLIRFQKVCEQCSRFSDRSVFSIVFYIRNLIAALTREAPQVAKRYRPFMAHLETQFFPIHDRLPIGFCHGDFHPLNMIWGKRSIRTVIDWEFCGFKPEMYDLANLLGCLGMEDPRSLNGPLVHRLVSRMKASGRFADESWEALPDLILAIRFAWLNEWMRKNDRSMIRLEADYMQLLLDSRLGLINLSCS
jgi:homoserine kinase type II